MPIYRTGFAHPLSLVHQCSKLLAETIYLFVRSESVLFERTQIDKVRSALNSFVRVHCFRCTASLQSFTQLVRDISKGSSRPSAIIDDSNNFAPVLPFGQFAQFSVPLTSGRTVIVILRVLASVRFWPRRIKRRQRHFDNCTPSSGQARRSEATIYYMVSSTSWRSTTGAPIVLV